MDKQYLQDLIKQGASSHRIADEAGTSQTNVMYWLKKHGLALTYTRNSDYHCRYCGETDPIKFYSYRKKVCGKCDNIRVKAKGRDNRQKVIEYLGGKCVKCGYNTYHCALDVHHLDPITKDPSFTNMRYWSWERTVEEIKNCILVCKNCHAAIHNGEF